MSGGEPSGDGGDPRAFWEQRYAGAAPVWSGDVNRMLAQVVDGWRPGRSLDLGCGEGGDVLWLAERGWHATGIDLSVTAIERARTAARAKGVASADRVPAEGAGGSVPERAEAGSAEFISADLADWVVQGSAIDRGEVAFDLITASFLQSPVELPRERILAAALRRLAPGGSLVLISHAAPPSWAQAGGALHAHDHGTRSERDGQQMRGPRFLSPADELAALGFEDPNAGTALRQAYVVTIAEIREREVADPNGRPALIEDSVVVVRRKARQEV